MIFISIVSMLSTCAIAYYAFASYNLSQEIKKGNERHQEELNDLYQAIVVATLLSGPSSMGNFQGAKSAFIQNYSGKTKIF